MNRIHHGVCKKKKLIKKKSEVTILSYEAKSLCSLQEAR